MGMVKIVTNIVFLLLFTFSSKSVQLTLFSAKMLTTGHTKTNHSLWIQFTVLTKHRNKTTKRLFSELIKQMSTLFARLIHQLVAYLQDLIRQIVSYLPDYPSKFSWESEMSPLTGVIHLIELDITCYKIRKLHQLV